MKIFRPLRIAVWSLVGAATLAGCVAVPSPPGPPTAPNYERGGPQDPNRDGAVSNRLKRDPDAGSAGVGPNDLQPGEMRNRGR